MARRRGFEVTAFIGIAALLTLSQASVPAGAQQSVVAGLRANAKLRAPSDILADYVNGGTETAVIVYLRPAAAAQALAVRSRASTQVPAEFTGPGAATYYNLQDESIRKQLHATVTGHVGRIVDGLGAAGMKVTQRFSYQFGFSARVTPAALERIVNEPEVIAVEKDMILHEHLAQGIPLINAASARSAYAGAGLSIAICDTGIDTSHPRLGGSATFPNAKVIGGYDTGDDDADPRPGSTGSSHGTACAGIAAGDTGTVGNYIGGVAPGAKLYAVKIATGTTGTATTSAMIAGWEWSVTHKNDDPANPIMIISTSFGGGRYTATCDSASLGMTTAAATAVAAGITIFASSGNDGYCNSTGWPACISYVNSVGAVYDASFGNYYPCVDSASCASKTVTTGCATGYYATDISSPDKVTAYSNSASFLTLFAPANQASTTDIVGSGGSSTGDFITSFGGTSAACPYAAGAAAVLQSAALAKTGSYLTPAQVKTYLVDNGDNVTDGKVAVTKPRINLGRAVNAFPPAVTSATSTTASGQYKAGSAVNVTLNFNGAVSSTGLTINLNSGGMLSTGAFNGVTSYSGTHTVGAGQTSAGLSVGTITGTITDAAGSATIDPTVPAGQNIADAKAIVIDTTAPVTTAAPGGGTYQAAQSVTLSCSDGIGSSGCASTSYCTGAGCTPSTPYSGGTIGIPATAELRFASSDGAGNAETVRTESYSICTFNVTPAGNSLPSNADLGSVAVTTQPGCAWSATTSDLWVSITAGAGGVGSGAVQYSVSANKTAGPRSGSIAVAGTSVTINQAAQGLKASFVGIVGNDVYENPFGPPPLAITFDAGGSTGLAAIGNYHWDFGDGATADTATARIDHSFSATGSYTVQLTITAGTEIDSTQRLVTVADAVHSVATSAGLQAALNTASSNGLNDIVRVAGGVYNLSANLDDVTLLPTHFTYTAATGEDNDLVIEGGWAPDFSQRADNIPTILQNDLGGTMPDGGVLSLDGASNATAGYFTVTGITITGGNSTGEGGGLCAITGGSINLSNCVIGDNVSGGAGGGFYLESTAGGIWLTGSRITGNTAGGPAGAGVVRAPAAYVYANEISGNSATSDGGLQAEVGADGALIVSSNTIHGNQAPAGSSGLAVGSAGSSGTAYLDVHNNIIYGNSGGAADFAVVPGCAYLMNYVDLNVIGNDVGLYSLCADYPLDSTNIAVEPLFITGGSPDIRLVAGDAQLIDSGTNVYTPTEDIEGDAVPLDGEGDTNAVPDIGADEYNPANAAGPAAIGITPASPTIGTVGGSATLTIHLDLAAKRDVMVYLTHADTNTGTPGQPLVTLTPQYLKILKGATSAQATVQALGAARHGTVQIAASDPSGYMTSGAATVTIDINIPGAVPLVAPAGVIVTATPTYTWNALAGADSYQLWVGSGPTTAIFVWYSAGDAGCASGMGTCSVTPATALAVGKWSFNIKARNTAGAGPWTLAQIFTYTVPFMPTPITLVSPAGVVGSATPTYTWNAMPTVASYQLWVGMGATTEVSQWYTAAQAGCASGTGTCSVTPATTLAQGKWAFNVQGRNIVGTGTWTTAKNFTYTTVTVPTALTLVSPAGVVPMVAPTYTWNALANVDTYLLWVGDGRSSSPIYQWYTAAQAGCASGEPTCSVTPATALTEGIWYFNVKGQNLAGTSPWATSRNFIYTNATLPTTLTLQSPSGTIGTNSPAYSWNALPGIDTYLLYVGYGATTAVNQRYTAAQAGCDTGSGTCSVTPATVLATGAWYFNVKGQNLAGTGPWAAAKMFTAP